MSLSIVFLYFFYGICSKIFCHYFFIILSDCAQKISAAVKVKVSVTGAVSQIPSIPHIVGKTKIVMSRMRIPRRKAITADCFGQLIEVKYMEPARLKPCSKNSSAKILNPRLTILMICVSSTKIEQ